MSDIPPSVVSLEVILKSESNRSFAKSDSSITSKNVTEYLPSATTIREASRRLSDLGFSVTPSETTLTLTGKPELFERVFGLCQELQDVASNGALVLNPDAWRKARIPEELRDIVEAVALPEPPEFFN